MLLQDRKQELQLPSFSKLPKEQQQTVLHTPHMQHLIRSVSSDGALALEGDKELVSKVMGCQPYTCMHIHSKCITCAYAQTQTCSDV